MLSFLLITIALATENPDALKIITLSGETIHFIKSKKLPLKAKIIRSEVAAQMHVKQAFRVGLVTAEGVNLRDGDIVYNQQKSLTAVINREEVQDIEELHDPPSKLKQNFQTAVTKVIDVATLPVSMVAAYTKFVLDVAHEIDRNTTDPKKKAGGAVCGCAIATPIGIAIFVWLLFHESFFGRYDWQLQRDSQHLVCSDWTLNTDFLDEGNKWQYHVKEFCVDGWDFQYRKTSGKYRTSWLEKNKARDATLTKREYDRQEMENRWKVKLDELIQARNKEFELPEKRNANELQEVEKAQRAVRAKEFKALVKDTSLANRRANHHKWLQVNNQKKLPKKML